MLELDGRSERRGNEIHHDSADFVVNILLLIIDSLLLLIDPLLLLVNPLLLLVNPLLQRSLTNNKGIRCGGNEEFHSQT